MVSTICFLIVEGEVFRNTPDPSLQDVNTKYRMKITTLYFQTVRIIFRPFVMCGFGTGMIVLWREPNTYTPVRRLVYSIYKLSLYSAHGGVCAICFPILPLIVGNLRFPYDPSLFPRAGSR